MLFSHKAFAKSNPPFHRKHNMRCHKRIDNRDKLAVRKEEEMVKKKRNSFPIPLLFYQTFVLRYTKIRLKNKFFTTK